jgi:hypothetical protein
MYTATMHYHFVPDRFEQACALWEKHVITAARSQNGFVRMHFLTAAPEALAIGTWQSKSDAEAFMKTGVFTRLMADLEVLCTEPPLPKVWELKYFEQA